MLEFLAPLWLLGLPLVLAPWIWPVLLQPRENPFPFSAFFLLPPESVLRKFRMTRSEWPLKLLRSLLVLLLVLLPAKPYWRTAALVKEIQIIDDTPSAQMQDIHTAASGPADARVRISELFRAAEEAPWKRDQDASRFHAGSPSLADIGTAAYERYGGKDSSEYLHLKLVSDFQKSQYWLYPAEVHPVRWSFHRPAGLRPGRNLALRRLRLVTSGMFETHLEGELRGNLENPSQVSVAVRQGPRRIGRSVYGLKGSAISIRLALAADYDRSLPVEVHLTSDVDEMQFDNVIHFQESTKRNPWVALMTSEGPAGIFRHGLHTLKSALNAAGYFSYLVVNPEQLEERPADVMVLLGDHPFRWEHLKSDQPRLFVPTRLGDWKDFASQQKDNTAGLKKDGVEKDYTNVKQAMPPGQWQVRWTSAPFAEEWLIRKVSDIMYVSDKNGMRLLATGFSPDWGGLYQQDDFADQLRALLMELMRLSPERSMGTFQSGSERMASVLENIRMQPGHYRIPDSTPTSAVQKENAMAIAYRFSVNLPERESEPRLMSDDELEEMQRYFDERAEALFPQNRDSAETVRRLLLWTVLTLILAEICWVLMRRTSETISSR